MSKQQLNTRKIFRAIGWAAVCLLVLVGFVAAANSTGNATCKGVEVVINDASDNFFISKENVLSWVKDWAAGDVKTVSLQKLNIKSLESEIADKQWVSKVDVFVDDAAILHIDITERQPAARMFNTIGQSFYVDKMMEVLPIHQQMAARVPVFTGFAGQMDRLNRIDSNVIAQAVYLGAALMKDTFLMAMIEQIDINAARQFEMIPKLGNHVIYFGDTAALEAKFLKLKAFYKNVLTVKGWNTYSAIYLDYKDQIVAKIKDSADVQADAARTLMLMEMMVTKAKATTADSIILPKAVNDAPIDSTVLLQSVERENEGEEDNTQPTPVTNVSLPDRKLEAASGNNVGQIKTENKPLVIKPKMESVQAGKGKLEVKKKEVAKKPPDKTAKAVMPKKNEKN